MFKAIARCFLPGFAMSQGPSAFGFDAQSQECYDYCDKNRLACRDACITIYGEGTTESAECYNNTCLPTYNSCNAQCAAEKAIRMRNMGCCVYQQSYGRCEHTSRNGYVCVGTGEGNSQQAVPSLQGDCRETNVDLNGSCQQPGEGCLAARSIFQAGPCPKNLATTSSISLTASTME